MRVTVVPTEELGDRSYVIDHDGWAIVIDPQRDIDRWERIVDERGLRVAMVCETHRHNDYVTGGSALAKALVAAYVVPSGEVFDHRDEAIVDGQQITVGDLTLRAIETPGHTLGHTAYVISTPGSPDAVFTGGSLLYGNVGRTDLVSPAHTDELTRAQLRSVRRLAGELEPDTRIYPTHGFGSFCAAGPATVVDLSTVGEERVSNPALADVAETEFVTQLIAGLDDYPSYYRYIGDINRRGPAAADLRPPARVSPLQLRERLRAGEWVVDLRPAAEFAGGHLAGTFNFPLGTSLATRLGWLAPWGAPITLLAPDTATVAEAVRMLARIGIEHPGALVAPDLPALAEAVDVAYRSYRRVRWEDLAAARGDGDLVLDVRTAGEHAEARIAGSLHIPLHHLADQADQLPRQPIWLHCQAGYRAAVAASMLDRLGFEVTLIEDDFDRAVELGLAERAVTPV